MNQASHQSISSSHAPVAETDPRCQRVFRLAQRLYRQRVDWVEFFRRILSPIGIVRCEFPSQQELQRFEQTSLYAQLQQWLASLRASQPQTSGEQEPTRVITVRLPQSLHELLRVEAHQHCTSMNQLCISKLLQMIEKDLVPGEKYRLGRHLLQKERE